MLLKKMINRNINLWAFTSLLLVLLNSCDPEEPIPAYLSIDSIGVKNLNYPLQGSANHNIKDAWVYIDNELLGVFELPARFPILKEGKHSVSISGGVFENGISATRVRYPLYTSFEVTADFIPGQTVNFPITPEINYFPGIAYDWFEDFEGNTYSFDSILGSKAGFIPFNNDQPFEGNFSGKIFINEAKNYFKGACTNDNVDINSFSTTWVELNVGIQVKKANGDVLDIYAVTINRSEIWNKIYINVSQIIGTNPTAQNFKVSLEAELEAGRTESNIYIDNIKLIHN
jgi:hypothetical protein